MSEELPTVRPITSPMKLCVSSAYYEIKGYSPYITAWTQTVKALDMMEIEWDYREVSGDSYVSRAKNGLVQDFLKSDFTHIFMIDSDLAWEIGGFLKVLKCGLEGAEIVGAAYPNKNTWENYGVVPILNDGKPVIKTIDNINAVQVYLLPGGFILYSRRAFERAKPSLDRYVDPQMIQEFYQYFKWMVQKSPFTGKMDNYVNHVKRIFAKALNEFGEYLGPNPDDIFLECFRCNIEKNNTLIGEDYYFQHRYREMGGIIWCVADVGMAHYGVKEWTGNYWNYLQNLYHMEEPATENKEILTDKPKILVNNFANCIPDLSPYFEIAKTTEEVDSIKAAIFWNDELEREREIINCLKKLGIPTFVMAHGALCACDSIYDDTLGEPLGYRVLADHYFIWSEIGKKLVEDKGGTATVVGCPWFDYDIPHTKDGKTVLYFPSHVFSENSVKIWEKLNQIDGINPVIKLLKGEHPLDKFPGKYIISNRFESPNHAAELRDAYDNASCVVVDIGGTEILWACKLNIPIIKIKNERKNYHPVFINEVNLADISDAVRMALADPGHQSKERLSFAREFETGDCAKNIATVINKHISMLSPEKREI